MSRLQIRTEYQPVCECGITYGGTFENEAKALWFIKKWPLCLRCEDAQ